MAEVVDVVVLGHDEALPLPRSRPLDLSVELEDHRVAVERELGRVRVRLLDQPAGPVGTDVAEATTIPAGGEIRDDLERFTGLFERPLESGVVARRHEELVRRAALPE